MSTIRHCPKCDRTHVYTRPCDEGAQRRVIAEAFGATKGQVDRADAAETVSLAGWHLHRGRRRTQ